eukprot:TRINITY_DN1493_c0_g2_i1.p1 TRINITY_DN1493_c0_g2~~TRINITY_DN1493_c0_g2_i1.p1  ORF type:complete len:146 (+),score=23.45 TRINITY_DN1493_c0_g2_i1:109-546(+)
MYRLGHHLNTLKQIGWKESLFRIWRNGELLAGNHVGTDAYGNKYYEDREALWGRDRWVQYVNTNFDASQVPAEWHTWLHHVSDEVPNEKLLQRLMPSYKVPHTPNLTGTESAYTSPHFLLHKNFVTPTRVKKWNPDNMDDQNKFI